MGITNFPHGLATMGVPLFPQEVVSGNVYWVGATAGASWLAGSNDSATAGEKGTPFATIDYAIGKCTGNNGDVIYVLPGHAETISAAGGITADIAGISIIGLGNGSLRPQLTLSATTSTIAVSAANVTFKNIAIVPGVAEIDIVFNVTGAECTLDGIWSTTNSTFSIERFVSTAATATRLVVKNCHLVQTVLPTAASVFIYLVGVDEARILNNFFRVALKNDAAAATIGGATTLSANVEISGNHIIQSGGTTQASAILMYTASTGVICDNRIFCGSTALAGILSPQYCHCAENYVENVYAKSAKLDPTVT
jgi:hypothetical protein